MQGDPGETPLVEVLSGATGAPLVSISGKVSWTASHFGREIAVGIEAQSASVRIGIGAPETSNGTRENSGKFEVWDMDGSMLLRIPGLVKRDRFGSSVAWLGDIDGDAIGDWAVGAPEADAPLAESGRVSLISGATGTVVRDLTGSFKSGRFGMNLAAVPDSDSDGVDDLLVSALYAAPLGAGQVQLYSAASGTLLATWSGTKYADSYGSLIGVLPDANHDGATEFLIGTISSDRLDIIASSSGRLLKHISGPPFSDFPTFLPAVDVYLAERLAAERSPNLAAASQRSSSSGFTDVLITAYDVGDLFLDINPTSAAPDETVTAFVRGGPPGAYAGIYVSRIDDLSFDQFLLFGYLDNFGEWIVADTTPTGLSGMTYALRAYTLGFDGRLAQSTDE